MKKLLLLPLCLIGLPPLLAAADDVAARAESNPLARQPLELFAQTRERPLFSPSRRPPPPPPVAVRREPDPPPPPPEPPSVMLVGVISDEQGARALVRPNPMDKVREVKIGDEIGGWKVTEIAPRRIVLGLEQRSSAFALFETRKGASKTAAARERQRR